MNDLLDPIGVRPADPAAESREALDAGPSALEALKPHPGRPVAWPPAPDQRGLAAPFPPGGADPEPDSGRLQDRVYIRLLIAMVVAIVLGGFAISLVGLLLGVGAGT